MAFQTRNPATGQELAHFPFDSAAQLAETLTQATAAAAHWGALPIEARAVPLMALADALEAQAPALARLAALEMGKPLPQGRAEVLKCAATARYFACHAATLLADENLTTAATPQNRALLIYEPLGVVLGVMPWNFPFWQVIRFAVPTLLAGNAVLVKHAPNIPQCAAALAAICHQTLPAGLYADLRIAPETVTGLLADPRVAAVSLTGSERAGAAVAAAAGQHLKKAVLELGGADAFVVLADADVPKAAETAARARLLNAGQSCIAAKRFIIAREVADEFVPLFVQHLAQASGGDPLAPLHEETLDYGPLARPDLARQLTRQVAATVKAGARILLDGGQPSPDSCFFRPMVLTDIPPDSPAALEELFGPVAALFLAADEADAIHLANATTFGLGGTVWGRDLTRAERVARALRCGFVTLNGLTASAPELPFGGRGRSGYGRELGALGIREFTSSKTLVFNA